VELFPKWLKIDFYETIIILAGDWKQGDCAMAKQLIERGHPDIGDPALLASAGGTVIGARKFLIAFNVNLGTDYLCIAREVARMVRASSGGLCHVKGIAVSLEERGVTQVSLNIADYERNALYRVLQLIRMEARRWGVQVLYTEI
jgi:glutamate formiminotransferase